MSNYLSVLLITFDLEFLIILWDFFLGGRSAKGKVWGSDEVNVEGWRPLKRLPGHESGMCFAFSWEFG